MEDGQRALPIVITGHVDHGKSTLIGRLLFETAVLRLDRYQEMRESSAEAGRSDEFAFVLDTLEEGRKRGIPIETSQIFFRTSARPYVLIDASGRWEFVRNMVTGVSYAEAAILIVDALEGGRHQTRRHARLLSLVGIREVCVAVNKLDLVGYDGNRYQLLCDEVQAIFGGLGLPPRAIVPISALQGENVTSRSTAMSWYAGPCLLEVLDGLESRPLEDRPFRFAVQDIYRFDGRSIVVGRVEAGSIAPGDTVRLLPGGREVRVVEILRYLLEGVGRASYGEAVGLILGGGAEGVARGMVLAGGRQPRVGSSFEANLFWFQGTYRTEDPLLLRCATQEVPVRICLERTYDPADPAAGERVTDRLEVGKIARCTIHAERPMVADSCVQVPGLGRFVVERDGLPAGGGIIL